MRHLEVWELERHSECNNGDAAWMRFCRRVESMLGHDLDGDGSENGYSLDEAHDFFRKSDGPEKAAREYAQLVKSRNLPARDRDSEA